MKIPSLSLRNSIFCLAKTYIQTPCSNVIMETCTIWYRCVGGTITKYVFAATANQNLTVQFFSNRYKPQSPGGESYINPSSHNCSKCRLCHLCQVEIVVLGQHRLWCSRNNTSNDQMKKSDTPWQQHHEKLSNSISMYNWLMMAPCTRVHSIWLLCNFLWLMLLTPQHILVIHS